jgi:hypothetical protein
MPAAKTYSSQDVTVLLGGVPIDSGRADGDFVSIVKVSDDSSSVAGADGEVCVNLMHDRQYDVTITVMQSSAGNDLMTGARAGFQLLKALLPLAVKDNNGSSLLVAAKAWPVKAPDQAFGKEAGTRAWTWRCVADVVFIGGN